MNQTLRRILLGAVSASAAMGVFSLHPLQAPTGGVPWSGTARAANPCNPCSPRRGQRGNPCNPCSAKAKNPCNPCNPCAGNGKKKHPCNPCTAKGRKMNPCNPCSAKAKNPCNPCSAKAKNPCNPCNPCAPKAKNPCNPCNPCAPKAKNPCNPCSAKGKAAATLIEWGRDYAVYDRTTGFVESASHGGRLVVTYVSPKSAADVYRVNARLVRQNKSTGFRDFPSGTVIVKESFLKDDKGGPGQRGPVFMMRKEPSGYDAGGGNWRYGFAQPDLALIGDGHTGNVAFCRACHLAVKARDYVYAVDR